MAFDSTMSQTRDYQWKCTKAWGIIVQLHDLTGNLTVGDKIEYVRPVLINKRRSGEEFSLPLHPKTIDSGCENSSPKALSDVISASPIQQGLSTLI